MTFLNLYKLMNVNALKIDLICCQLCVPMVLQFSIENHGKTKSVKGQGVHLFHWWKWIRFKHRHCRVWIWIGAWQIDCASQQWPEGQMRQAPQRQAKNHPGRAASWLRQTDSGPKTGNGKPKTASKQSPMWISISCLNLCIIINTLKTSMTLMQ